MHDSHVPGRMCNVHVGLIILYIREQNFIFCFSSICISIYHPK